MGEGEGEEWKLPPGMDVEDGGGFRLYRLAHSCGWTSISMDPLRDQDSWRYWRSLAEGHVCSGMRGHPQASPWA